VFIESDIKKTPRCLRCGGLILKEFRHECKGVSWSK